MATAQAALDMSFAKLFRWLFPPSLGIHATWQISAVYTASSQRLQR